MSVIGVVPAGTALGGGVTTKPHGSVALAFSAACDPRARVAAQVAVTRSARAFLPLSPAYRTDEDTARAWLDAQGDRVDAALALIEGRCELRIDLAFHDATRNATGPGGWLRARAEAAHRRERVQALFEALLRAASRDLAAPPAIWTGAGLRHSGAILMSRDAAAALASREWRPALPGDLASDLASVLVTAPWPAFAFAAARCPT